MKRMRVLVVEDNADDVELTLDALEELNFAQVEVASDGAQALTLLQRGPVPDLVLLDLRLPLLDGLEVLARLRSSQALKAIKVVVLTSSESPRDMAVCQSLGVTGYLGKPLNGAALLACLGCDA